MPKNSKPKPTPRKRVGTPLDDLLRQAVSLSHSLDELERQTKLSTKAFVREAVANAGIDRHRVRTLRKQIDGAEGCYHAVAFVRRLASEFKSAQFPRPPRDAAKMLRVFGHDAAGTELRELGLRVADAVAVAALISTELHPDHFGSIESWDEHQSKLREARQRLDWALEQMHDAVSGRDLRIDVESLTPTERDAGLARVSFKRHPFVLLSNPDWPRALVTSEKRRTVSRAAA